MRRGAQAGLGVRWVLPIGSDRMRANVAETLRHTFGHNLRAHRESLGLSQEELGEKIDQQRAAVGAIERAERNITLVTLEKITKGLDLAPGDLLTSAPRTARE